MRQGQRHLEAVKLVTGLQLSFMLAHHQIEQLPMRNTDRSKSTNAMRHSHEISVKWIWYSFTVMCHEGHCIKVKAKLTLWLCAKEHFTWDAAMKKTGIFDKGCCLPLFFFSVCSLKWHFLVDH